MAYITEARLGPEKWDNPSRNPSRVSLTHWQVKASTVTARTPNAKG